MYDFYPEWGPARHRDEAEARPAERRQRYWQAQQQQANQAKAHHGPEARDDAEARPDDN